MLPGSLMIYVHYISFVTVPKLSRSSCWWLQASRGSNISQLKILAVLQSHLGTFLLLPHLMSGSWSRIGCWFRCVPNEKQFPPPPMSTTCLSSASSTLLWLCSISGHFTAFCNQHIWTSTLHPSLACHASFPHDIPITCATEQCHKHRKIKAISLVANSDYVSVARTAFLFICSIFTSVRIDH